MEQKTLILAAVAVAFVLILAVAALWLF